ncbi:TB2/DP1/HVA22-related protein [Sesbania bispinosa]|nr:TB2/DP1/HVA22-related protein [Sesbania bispinosa]
MSSDFIIRSLTLLLGYAYPALECYKTVEKNRVSNEELRFWCQYWIIVAFLTVLEKFADVFMEWLPLYGEMKLSLFIYLWYPKTKGTGYVYNAVLRPYVSSHEHFFDKKFQEWRTRAWEMANFYLQNYTQMLQSSLQVFNFLAAQSKRFSGKTSRNKVNYSNILTNESFLN